MLMSAYRTLSFLLMSAALAVGCGPDRPETAPVSGVVKIDGKVVPEGTITFYPKVGPVAASTINSNGHYSLTTYEPNDGAVLGEHRVAIRAVRIKNAAETAKSFEEEIMQAQQQTKKPRPVMQWLVLPVYANDATSPLRETVVSGENTIDFDLKIKSR